MSFRIFNDRIIRLKRIRRVLLIVITMNDVDFGKSFPQRAQFQTVKNYMLWWE